MSALVLLPVLVLAKFDTLERVSALEASPAFESLEDVEDDAGGSALMEDLDWICSHPYDLNRVTLEQLLTIPSVSVAEGVAVLGHRKAGNVYHTVEDLLTIEGGGGRLYTSLRPFVTVAKEARAITRSSFRLRVAEVEPSDPGIVGSPAQLADRVTVQERSVECGGIFAKRAGERITDGFVSGYVMVHDTGTIRAIILGDFDVLPGQGLLFSKGPSPLKNNWSASYRSRSVAPIAPHRSADQSRYLRGLALSLGGRHAWGTWETATFASERYYGATLNSQGEATGIYSGSYTTRAAAAKRNVLRERLLGIRAAYGFAQVFSVGWTAYRACLNKPIRPQDGVRLSGNSLQGLALDARSSLGALDLFAEWAILGRRRTALACGSTAHFSPACSMVLAYRDYDPGYDNPHASGFSDNGETRNERGLYAGVELVPSPLLTIQWFLDQVSHPWPSIQEPLPRRAAQTALSAQIALPADADVTVRYSEKKADVVVRAKDPWGKSLYGLGSTAQRLVRCSANAHPSSSVHLTTQIEIVRTCDESSANSRGVLVFQQVSVVPVSSLTLSGRLVLFQTDTYSARVYELESDLPGLFCSPPLSGRGRRWYALVRYSPVPWLAIVLKYATTEQEQPAMNSGTAQNDGTTHVHSFGLQLDGRIP